MASSSRWPVTGIPTRQMASSSLRAAHPTLPSAISSMFPARSRSSSASPRFRRVRPMFSWWVAARFRRPWNSTPMSHPLTRRRPAARSSTSATKACGSRFRRVSSRPQTRSSGTTRSPKCMSRQVLRGRSASRASSSRDCLVCRCGTAIPRCSNSTPTDSACRTRLFRPDQRSVRQA